MKINFRLQITHPISERLNFEQEKNKSIKTVTQYEFFADGDHSNLYYFGVPGLAGMLEQLSYHEDQPERALFPNHTQMKERLYEGDSLLGKVKIYLLECDLYDDVRKEINRNTHEMIYSCIPIEGEILAYYLSIAVPFDDDYEKYLNMAKSILGIE